MKINRAATVIPVSDLDASLRFFIEVLGFSEDFRFGQYAGIKRDDCCLHLSVQDNPNTSAPGTGTVYFFCDEVDRYFAQIAERGAVTDGPPRDYDYGMRDFIARDPDRNRLMFGTPTQGGLTPGPEPVPDGPRAPGR